jgi:hypothetical protein
MSSNNGQFQSAPPTKVTPGPVFLGGKVARRVNSPLENNGCKVSFPPLSAEETAQLFGTSSSEAEKLRIDQEKWEKLCQERANLGEKNVSQG